MPTAKGKTSTESLALRIIVLDPPPNILWALQLGQDEMVKPSSATKSRISFDFAVQVVDGSSKGAFRLRGPAVQGRPGERFVYLRIGTYAGQTGTDVARRAKIGLEGITRKLLDDGESQARGRSRSAVRRHRFKGWCSLRNSASAGQWLVRRVRQSSNKQLQRTG